MASADMSVTLRPSSSRSWSPGAMPAQWAVLRLFTLQTAIQLDLVYRQEQHNGRVSVHNFPYENIDRVHLITQYLFHNLNVW